MILFEWKVRFEPRDLWIGIYWNATAWESTYREVDVYVCVLPLLPVKLNWTWYTDRYHTDYEEYNDDEDDED